VSLIEDGRWKLDRIVGFVEFDREKMVLELGRAILRAAAGSNSDVRAASCFVAELEDLGDATIESLVLDRPPDLVLELSQPCLPRSQVF
jgi:hypothetical protein